jgi:hypothetical protein
VAPAWRRCACAAVLAACIDLLGRPGLADEAVAPDLPPRAEFVATRNGEAIGRCIFEFARSQDALDVLIDVRLTIRILSIPVYRWSHHAVEHWQGGRLQTMSADTDDDGKRRHVEAAREATGTLALVVDQRRVAVDADAVPASFWNPAVLSAGVVIDAVTGNAARPEVQRVADEPDTAGTAVSHYRVASEAGLKQEVWFDAANRLVQFTAFASDGSAIAYRPAPAR